MQHLSERYPFQKYPFEKFPTNALWDESPLEVLYHGRSFGLLRAILDLEAFLDRAGRLVIWLMIAGWSLTVVILFLDRQLMVEHGIPPMRIYVLISALGSVGVLWGLLSWRLRVLVRQWEDIKHFFYEEAANALDDRKKEAQL